MISSRYMCGNFACPHQHFDFSSSVRWVHFPAVAVDGLKISFLQESRGEYSFHLFTDIRELLKHEVPDAIEFINLIKQRFSTKFLHLQIPMRVLFSQCISAVTNQAALHFLCIYQPIDLACLDTQAQRFIQFIWKDYPFISNEELFATWESILSSFSVLNICNILVFRIHCLLSIKLISNWKYCFVIDMCSPLSQRLNKILRNRLFATWESILSSFSVQ